MTAYGACDIIVIFFHMKWGRAREDRNNAYFWNILETLEDPQEITRHGVSIPGSGTSIYVEWINLRIVFILRARTPSLPPEFLSLLILSSFRSYFGQRMCATIDIRRLEING